MQRRTFPWREDLCRARTRTVYFFHVYISIVASLEDLFFQCLSRFFRSEFFVSGDCEHTTPQSGNFRCKLTAKVLMSPNLFQIARPTARLTGLLHRQTKAICRMDLRHVGVHRSECAGHFPLTRDSALQLRALLLEV